MNEENWIKIIITNEMIQQAIWREIEVSYEANKNELHNIFISEDKWIGNLGELVVEQYLTSIGIDFEVDKPVGHADKYDLKINGKSYDVKTGHKLTPRKLSPNYDFLININQITKPNIHAFIHVQVVKSMKFAYIIGWITRKEALTYPVRKKGLISPAIAVPFAKLYPIWS